MSNKLKPQLLPSARETRRIDLLILTIRLLSTTVSHKYRLYKSFSPEKRFWGELSGSIVTVAAEDWPHSVFSGQASLVNTLLESFESILDWEYEQTSASKFPRLEHLRHKWEMKLGDEGHYVAASQLLLPRDMEGFKEQLRRLSEVLVNTIESQSPEPVLQNLTPPRKATRGISMWPKLKNMLAVISNHWKCRCQPHSAALVLLTYGKILEGPVAFSMLFKHEKFSKWLESSITISEQFQQLSKKQTKACPSIPEYGRLSPASGHRVDSLCAEILRMRQARLSLDVKGRDLYRWPDEDLQMKEFRDGKIISLSEGILNNDNELRSKAKECLAIILSWSLLDFCDEPWFRGGWTKDTIHLMRHGDKLSLRPLLVTKMDPQKTPGQSGTQPPMSESVMLLHHSVLLMEIFLQESSGIDFVNGTPAGIMATRKQIIKLYKKVKWDVNETFKKSVQACIDASEANTLSSRSEQRAEFVRTLYERVIMPLQTQFEEGWNPKDPDEAITSFDYHISHQRSERGFVQTVESEPDPLSVTYIKRLHWRHESMFYDARDEPGDEKIDAAMEWFVMFDGFRDEMPPKEPKSKSGKIKIAILDTGINMDMQAISTKRGRIKCRPDQSACHDEDGHGSHVAYLLLKLAPHAQLLITKVSNSKLLGDADIDRIAEAITYYSSGDDKADIINISFGFPTMESKYKPIQKAIEGAVKNNVLIFAAAGNNGKNRSLSWPARMTDHVLCIGSSDGMGVESGFSTSTGLGRKIRTLGAGVPSCELKAGSKTEYINRNGTSFAAPIAVGIASIVLAFADEARYDPKAFHLPKDAWRLRYIRSKSGMEKVLCEMCTRQDDPERHKRCYITPWDFLGIEKNDRARFMLSHLRNIE